MLKWYIIGIAVVAVFIFIIITLRMRAARQQKHIQAQQQRIKAQREAELRFWQQKELEKRQRISMASTTKEECQSDSPQSHVDLNMASQRGPTNKYNSITSKSHADESPEILALQMGQLDLMKFDEMLAKCGLTRKEQKAFKKQVQSNPALEHYFRESIKKELYKKYRHGF